MSLDPERWERVQALFHEALDLPEARRQAFLEARCGGDADLVASVLAMLESDARGGSLLDRELGAVAGQVLGVGGALPPELGPYRILSLLGEGGMGVVYLAEREDLGTRVAIKTLRDAALSPARRERFLAEQRMLAQLNHPSIARLYDADALPDGTPYFVMEYVEGVPLTEYCRTHDCSIAERLRLFEATCAAVQHAHRHTVVHRDLKPSNILVTDDGVVKLLDFGIARQLADLEPSLEQTLTMLRLMTPAYAAPEQLRGEPVGVYTDVYALGVILYELLTGRLPFDVSGRTPGQVEAVILERDPERPSSVARRAAADPAGASAVAGGVRSWADLDVLCLTAMQREPQRRYGSVEALLRDLEHYRKGEPLEARPDTAGYRLGKFLRRNWRAAAAAGVAASLVVGLVAFYTARLATARDAALAEAARVERIQRFMLSLFQGGDAAAGPADTLRVITLLDRGVQEAGVLDGEPAIQAELYHTLGGIYQQLGEIARADSLLTAALEGRRVLYGPEHADVAASLVALGRLRLAQAEPEEGERLIRQGLEQARRLLPPDHPTVAEALTALGEALQERGEFAEAIAVLEEAVRLRAAHAPASTEHSNALTALANTHFYAGDYGVADSLNRVVLELDRRLYGERHPAVAVDLVNLGAVQFRRARYAEAERYYREALAVTESYFGPEHYRTAAGLTMLGRALVYQERYDQAMEPLGRALVIRERVFGPVHPTVASTLNELGTVALGRADHATAVARYNRMASIYRAVYGESHYLVGIALSNLATTYMRAGDPARAEPIFREAVALFLETLPPDHDQTAIARIKLGHALAEQARWAEAEEYLAVGYEVLSARAVPSVKWLRSAREDLARVYDALSQPEKAARFRAEVEAGSGAGR